jgi:hypothetical protein
MLLPLGCICAHTVEHNGSTNWMRVHQKCRHLCVRRCAKLGLVHTEIVLCIVRARRCCTTTPLITLVRHLRTALPKCTSGTLSSYFSPLVAHTNSCNVSCGRTVSDMRGSAVDARSSKDMQYLCSYVHPFYSLY